MLFYSVLQYSVVFKAKPNNWDKCFEKSVNGLIQMVFINYFWKSSIVEV